MAFKNLDDLFKHVTQDLIQESMNDDLAHVARNTLKENVITEVYDPYTPKSYKRTGGLLQDSNIETNMINDNTLSVRSIRKDGNRDIAEIIEYGKGYIRSHLDDEIGERPFHEETARELNETGKARDALRDGLRKRGVNVK